MHETESNEKLRIDKWLWVARFYKTRSLAVDAIESGKVTLGGVNIKPAKTVGIGDLLLIRFGPYHHEIEVLALSNKRGPAPVAQTLYRETATSLARCAAQAAEIKAQDVSFRFKGRPTKKDRREIAKFRSHERG